MINVEQASAFVKRFPIELDNKLINIEESCGCYLAQSISAVREQPPFDRVAMDGIALRFTTVDKKVASIAFYGIQKAGSSALCLEVQDGAIEVMTGAPLPENCDTVIPYEEITITDGVVKLNHPQNIKLKQNIHFQGSDYSNEQVLVNNGSKVNATTIAIMASQGMRQVRVKSLPKIAIISTGDELVELGTKPQAWEIWRSNPYALKSELIGVGGITASNIQLFHLADNKENLFKELEQILKEFKVIILSGGVSKGKFDFIPSVLADLNVETIFHKVKQRPGKPMYFGKGSEGQNIFGLPGNPVSALVSMRRYVIESLLFCLGAPASVEYVELGEDIKFSKSLTLFKAMKLESTLGKTPVALCVAGSGSGNFFSLNGSNGFVELAQEIENFKAGDIVPFYRWNRS